MLRIFSEKWIWKANLLLAIASCNDVSLSLWSVVRSAFLRDIRPFGIPQLRIRGGFVRESKKVDSDYYVNPSEERHGVIHHDRRMNSNFLDREGNVDIVSFFAHLERVQFSLRTVFAPHLFHNTEINSGMNNETSDTGYHQTQNKSRSVADSAIRNGTRLNSSTAGRYKRCQHQGRHGRCNGLARYGEAHESGPRVCGEHRNASHVDLRNPRCAAPEGCGRLASYGVAGTARFCMAHKSAGDVNVRRRKCLHPTCTRPATHAAVATAAGVAERGGAVDRCAEHAGAEQRDTRRNLCRQAGCGKEASYGPPVAPDGGGGRRRARINCAAHRQEGQVPLYLAGHVAQADSDGAGRPQEPALRRRRVLQARNAQRSLPRPSRHNDGGASRSQRAERARCGAQAAGARVFLPAASRAGLAADGMLGRDEATSRVAVTRPCVLTVALRAVSQSRR